MSPDAINGLYELLGGFFLWRNVRQLHREKQVKGVSAVSTAFFASWGVWNLYFYPHLGQWFSFLGGLNIVVANLVWVGQMIRYTRPAHLCELGECLYPEQHARPAAGDLVPAPPSPDDPRGTIDDPAFQDFGPPPESTALLATRPQLTPVEVYTPPKLLCPGCADEPGNASTFTHLGERCMARVKYELTHGRFLG